MAIRSLSVLLWLQRSVHYRSKYIFQYRLKDELRVLLFIDIVQSRNLDQPYNMVRKDIVGHRPFRQFGELVIFTAVDWKTRLCMLVFCVFKIFGNLLGDLRKVATVDVVVCFDVELAKYARMDAINWKEKEERTFVQEDYISSWTCQIDGKRLYRRDNRAGPRKDRTQRCQFDWILLKASFHLLLRPDQRRFLAFSW